MRLSDRDIVTRMLAKDRGERITITPLIHARDQIGPSSVNLHLGYEFLVSETSELSLFDPLMSEAEYDRSLFNLRITQRTSAEQQFVLHPHEFVLSHTLEYISLPNDIVGRIDGRSSWARQGLEVHATAGDIHPGTNGFIVFELKNVGTRPFALYPGLPVAQIAFTKLLTPSWFGYSERRQSKYSGFMQTLWSAYQESHVLSRLRELRLANGVTDDSMRYSAR